MKAIRLSISLSAAVAALAGLACSATVGSRTPAATPAPTPTPSPLSRVNPNIVEETETYFIERFPKKDYIRVDDRHIRHPIIGLPIEFFKEDADFYYVYQTKYLPEEAALKRAEEQRAEQQAQTPGKEDPNKKDLVPPSDFSDLRPPEVARPLTFQKVDPAGLPSLGMWRASFVLADMNGDGILDIVAPPARLGGESTLHVWLGDGRGKFTRWPVSYTQGGKPLEIFSLAYGGVAVGDIDGDGHMDVVAASHGGGLVSLFGNGSGSFEVVRNGLPSGRVFSSQAVALIDADGDGKLDIVASSDAPTAPGEEGALLDKRLVRVYLNRPPRSWEFEQDGIVGGFYSNSVQAWDFDGDGARDVLTGSHHLGALVLLWKNDRNGSFSPVTFPEMEIYSYHFATSPGTFGARRVPAFADAFSIHTNTPAPTRAAGVNIYAFDKGTWSRHRVFRKKDANMFLYAVALGDLDRDGLDDVVIPDSEEGRLRIFFQKLDGSFEELNAKEEPALDAPGQCVRLADLDGDGRLDIVLAKTVSSARPGEKGGWGVFLNRAKSLKAK